jgi:hypothetical protein
MGAKIGIGVGAGIGALFALILCIWLVRLKRHKQVDNTDPHPPQVAQTPKSYHDEYRKSIATTVSPVNSPYQPASPYQIEAARQSYPYPAQDHIGWEPPQSQPQQSYFRMPPQRFGETQVAMPTPGSVSPPSYNELPGDSRVMYEMRANTPAPQRWP